MWCCDLFEELVFECSLCISSRSWCLSSSIGVLIMGMMSGFSLFPVFLVHTYFLFGRWLRLIASVALFLLAWLKSLGVELLSCGPAASWCSWGNWWLSLWKATRGQIVADLFVVLFFLVWLSFLLLFFFMLLFHCSHWFWWVWTFELYI